MGTFYETRVGEVRISQALHTYGVGSIIDLPNVSVMALGLHRWPPPMPANEIVEDRLLNMVKSHLGEQVDRLCIPPVAHAGASGRIDPLSEDAKIGIPVAPFPGWVRCPRCQLLAPLDYGVFKLVLDPYRPDRTKYVHENCPKPGKPPTVVPARFVIACENGHLDDFPWQRFIGHKKDGCKGPLEFREAGVSSEVADLYVYCRGCETTRPMTGAFRKDADLGACTAMHPHLGKDSLGKCDVRVRAIMTGASNLWFPIILSALSVPTQAGKLERLVKENWPVLRELDARENLDLLRRLGQLTAFSSFSDEEVWGGIQNYRAGDGQDGPKQVSELKKEEWRLFSSPEQVAKTRDFHLETAETPGRYSSVLAEVVRAHRLRVVRALVGFTRIGSPGDFGDIAEIPEVRRAPLTRSLAKWVPASETRGEGLFIRFREEALSAWTDLPEVKELTREFREAHREFRAARGIAPPDAGFPGIRYILLHSFSHSLIQQFSIECGYSAASLAERIYSAESWEEGGPMAGILLYTAAPDSEGTLGGLVALAEGQHLERHLQQALEHLELCASDPLCSEHRPEADGRTIHGASCHACLFVSETSCERGNKYLDRSVLVSTVSGQVPPFFSEGAGQ